MPYRLLIDIEVFDQLQSLPAARRRTLFAQFRHYRYSSHCLLRLR
jgi:hypothetical protein